MKKFKKVLIFALVVVSAFALASCGGKDDVKTSSFGAGTKDDYKTYFTEDWETFNYLTSSKQHDSDWYANFVDGLVETNRFGDFVPALEETHTNTKVLDENGNTTWTFVLKDTSWVDQKGKVNNKVVANDFVTAAKFILTPTNGSQATSMWFTFIDGAKEWYTANYVVANYDSATAETDKDGKVIKTVEEVKASMLGGLFTDKADAQATVDKTFDNVVGIKDVDGKVVYTVKGIKPYFYSVLTYGAFFPVSESYLLDKGTDFGKNMDNILYNGGYIMKEWASKSSAKLVANDKYWDTEHVYIKDVDYKYIASTNDSDVRTAYESGAIDGFVVNPQDKEGYKKYVSGADGTGTAANPVNKTSYSSKAKGSSVYTAFFNVNRGEYSTESDYFGNWSTHNQASYSNTHKAISNTDFRLMFTYGINFVDYTTNFYGYGLPYQSRGWTLSNLVSNNKKEYGQYFADEFLKENPYVDKNLTEKEVFQSLYNDSEKDIVHSAKVGAEKAQAAYDALTAEGVTFPVKVEVNGSLNAAKAVVVEEFFGNLGKTLVAKDASGKDVQMVNFTIIEVATQEEENNLYYGGYCDFNKFSGWSADYADPLTFLNCYTIGGDFYNNVGMDGAVKDGFFQHYTDLINEAKAISDLDDRYAAFAKAEYDLIFKEGLVLPFLSASSLSVKVSKVLPYSSLKAKSGISDSKFKYLLVGTEVVTQDDYQVIKAAYESKNTSSLEAAYKLIASKMAK